MFPITVNISERNVNAPIGGNGKAVALKVPMAPRRTAPRKKAVVHRAKVRRAVKRRAVKRQKRRVDDGGIAPAADRRGLEMKRAADARARDFDKIDNRSPEQKRKEERVRVKQGFLL